MKTYDMKVYRDGRWWMIEIPELDGLTQTRRISEIRKEAIDYIAVTTDVAASAVKVNLTSLVIDDVDVLADEQRIETLRRETQRLQDELSEQMRHIAKKLADHQVPVRDIGDVLHVSHQRADQLIKA